MFSHLQKLTKLILYAHDLQYISKYAFMRLKSMTDLKLMSICFVVIIDECITVSKPPLCLTTFNQGTLLDFCQILTIYLHFVLFIMKTITTWYFTHFCKGMSDNTQNLLWCYSRGHNNCAILSSMLVCTNQCWIKWKCMNL